MMKKTIFMIIICGLSPLIAYLLNSLMTIIIMNILMNYEGVSISQSFGMSFIIAWVIAINSSVFVYLIYSINKENNERKTK